eukprot:1073914-Prorocentrum_lima.AAC.1
MTSSLVGSEMCIRDSLFDLAELFCLCGRACSCRASAAAESPWDTSVAVSYTHLTLPTICSV